MGKPLAQVIAGINANVPDNTTKLVSARKTREVLNDICDCLPAMFLEGEWYAPAQALVAGLKVVLSGPSRGIYFSDGQNLTYLQDFTNA